MSKTDDMRRQREERAAEQLRKHNAAPPAVPTESPVAPPKVSAPKVSLEAAAVANEKPGRAAKPQKSDATEGKCTGCGKSRPLVNGLVTNHQKGFGKMCPGARKEPA